jgi:hypothetical protein
MKPKKHPAYKGLLALHRGLLALHRGCVTLNGAVKIAPQTRIRRLKEARYGTEPYRSSLVGCENRLPKTKLIVMFIA